MFSSVTRLVEPAKILIIIGIAYTLVSTGMYFFAGPAPEPTTQVGSRAAPTGSGNRAFDVDVDGIAARHLFGEASAQQVTAAPAVIDAPETRLRLTLEGVFTNNADAGYSSAIVAPQNQPGELYLVGDRIAGDALLAEVHSDRIILQRGSIYETLRFSDAPVRASGTPTFDSFRNVDDSLPEYHEPDYEDEPDVQPSMPMGDATMHEAIESRSREVRETVQQYRERLSEDPEGTLSELGVVPIADDSAEGYRLGALAQHPALRQSGLQSEDVILSVNGRPVGNIQQDRQQIDSVLAEGSVRLEVQRGNRRLFITTAL